MLVHIFVIFLVDLAKFPEPSTIWKVRNFITSWWFQPIWKILVKMGIFPFWRGENKKYLKPPPRLSQSGWIPRVPTAGEISSDSYRAEGRLSAINSFASNRCACEKKTRQMCQPPKKKRTGKITSPVKVSQMLGFVWFFLLCHISDVFFFCWESLHVLEASLLVYRTS